MSTPPHNPSRSSPRSSRRSVHAFDRIAETTITVGGISVIIAVLGICVYLAAQVAPLFTSGRADPAGVAKAAPVTAPPALFRVDEYRGVGVSVAPGGAARSFLLADGTTLGELPPSAEAGEVTCVAHEPISGLIAMGLKSGKVLLGGQRFDSELLLGDDVTEAMRRIPVGGSMAEAPSESRPLGSAVQRISESQFRRLEAVLKFKVPADIKDAASPIHAIDYRESSGSEYMAVLRKDGQALLELVTTTTPLGGGAPRVEFEEFPIPFETPAGRSLPDWFFVTGDGQSVLALWRDGLLRRYSSSHAHAQPIRHAEDVPLLPAGRRITTASMLLGGLTILIGDDAGFVTRAMVAVDPAADTVDGQRAVISASNRVSDTPIVSISTSVRDRCVAVVDEAGRSGIFNTISDKWVLPMDKRTASVPAISTITPKVDGLVTLASDGAIERFDLTKGYPEASFKSLFGKVHYEGQPKPEYVYQSSTGEDTAEVKYSLIPLIHGTLKSTLFAMVFAVPFGVLSAVYTSEFLSRNARKVIKPTIEMMASLPSVVLGFLAAIVLAPFVAEHLPSILMMFFALPTGMLLGGFLWQIIPRATVKRIPIVLKLVTMFAVFGGSIGASWLVGPLVERTLFQPTQADRWVLAGLHEPAQASEIPAWVGRRTTMSGADRRELREHGLYFADGAVVKPRAPKDEQERAGVESSPLVAPLREGSVRGWLDGNFGDGFPGWFLLFLAPAAIAATVTMRMTFGPRIDRIVEASPQSRGAAIELARFLGVLGVSLVISFLAARALSAAGVDSRSSILGAFSQRNSLVVGLMMGFAVIPIIYTISEDAMAAVPSSLRSASLGAGATPWQTATRVVMPVAASGIFSAIMIGLGRAVGETMIVVMATGNTPDLSWNMFSGCRTLSANIATELPEASQGDVHYRVLFLCGLVLFVMTFALNTTAEIIRQRFRKRSAAL